jgi:hypothetical protein
MIAYSPLLACYGGGHSYIIAALARAMVSRGITPRVIGFTTGYRSLLRAGISAESVEALFDPEEDADYLDMASAFVSSELHPDVTERETLIYYALGLRDLAERLGRDAALKAVQAQGRKAFEPVSVMARYLRRNQPDIVITTTSPRFESALLKAGRETGIPTLAVGDLFLVQEQEWICRSGYADNLAVLSADVADFVAKAGFNGRIRVTGNPAFDSLALRSDDWDRRRKLREDWGVAGKTVILWPAPGGPISMIGRPFVTPEAVISAFEGLCSRDETFYYIYRLHPNDLDAPVEGITSGKADRGDLSPEDALLIADIVCVEASTMGLQAALRGLPVICVGFSDYVMYPQFGMAQSVDSLDTAMAMIAERQFAAPARDVISTVGHSTTNVLSFVDDILAGSEGAMTADG